MYGEPEPGVPEPGNFETDSHSTHISIPYCSHRSEVYIPGQNLGLRLPPYMGYRLEGYLYDSLIGGFHKWDPQNGSFIMDNPVKWDDLG